MLELPESAGLLLNGDRIHPACLASKEVKGYGTIYRIEVIVLTDGRKVWEAYRLRRGLWFKVHTVTHRQRRRFPRKIHVAGEELWQAANALLPEDGNTAKASSHLSYT